jgi:hypothetical protein
VSEFEKMTLEAAASVTRNDKIRFSK